SPCAAATQSTSPTTRPCCRSSYSRWWCSDRQDGCGLRRCGVKAEALLEIEPYDLPVVRVVADGDVLARVEVEVTAAEAQDNRTAQAGRPEDRAFDDLSEVLQERVAAMFGGLDHEPVLLAPGGEAARPPAAALQQRPAGAGHDSGIPIGGPAERHRVVRRCLGDSLQCSFPAAKDGGVLRRRDLIGGVVERAEIGVVGAAVRVTQLLARDGEVGSKLDER